ncbi:hypothetical protein ACE6JH_25415 [Streptomyces nigra]
MRVRLLGLLRLGLAGLLGVAVARLLLGVAVAGLRLRLAGLARLLRVAVGLGLGGVLRGLLLGCRLLGVRLGLARLARLLGVAVRLRLTRLACWCGLGGRLARVDGLNGLAGVRLGRAEAALRRGLLGLGLAGLLRVAVTGHRRGALGRGLRDALLRCSLLLRVRGHEALGERGERLAGLLLLLLSGGLRVRLLTRGRGRLCGSAGLGVRRHRGLSLRLFGRGGLSRRLGGLRCLRGCGLRVGFGLCGGLLLSGGLWLRLGVGVGLGRGVGLRLGVLLRLRLVVVTAEQAGRLGVGGGVVELGLGLGALRIRLLGHRGNGGGRFRGGGRGGRRCLGVVVDRAQHREAGGGRGAEAAAGGAAGAAGGVTGAAGGAAGAGVACWGCGCWPGCWG